MVETGTLDDVDLQVLHALQTDGRASFARIAEVLGVADQTVARRYRRLRAAGVVRVVGQTDPWRIGETRWYVRIRCTPDAAATVAEALARRPDTFWVHLMSGGTEVNCVVQPRTPHDRDALLLQKLPRTPRVVGVSAHSLLHQFFGGSMEHPALVDALAADQVRALRQPEATTELVRLSEKDHQMIAVLGADGRASHAELAAATGWSETSVRRRLEHLRHTGILYFDVDLDPVRLGFTTQARIWLSVPPSALEEVGQALAQHPEVAFAAATTGPSNVVASVVCRDGQELYRYTVERLGALTAIQHAETAPVIRTVKSAGAVLPSTTAR